jgi:hypothetical protein
MDVGEGVILVVGVAVLAGGGYLLVKEMNSADGDDGTAAQLALLQAQAALAQAQRPAAPAAPPPASGGGAGAVIGGILGGLGGGDGLAKLLGAFA